MLGWEQPVLAAIRAVRNLEMRYSGRMSYIRAANMTLQFISVPLFAFVTFSVVCPGAIVCMKASNPDVYSIYSMP